MKTHTKLDQCLCIEATAGSGKTTLMVQRLSDLILNHNVLPEQCLAITFTEKAAKEMNDRLIHKFKMNNDVTFPIDLVSKMTISTIHSFCQGILSKHALNIEQSPKFQIIEGLEKVNRLNQIITDLYLTNRNNPPMWLTTCLSTWSQEQFSQLLFKAYSNRDKINYWLENDFISIDKDILDNLGDFHTKYVTSCNALHKAITEFFTLINKDKITNDWLDYDDILTKTFQLFANTDWLRDQYQEQFRYIFVDEFQDTSPIQWQIVKQLCGDSNPFESNKLWLVGDRCQAIYGFRGADDTLMQMVIETNHNNLKHHKNTNNYRSHPIIVNFINQLFERLFADQNETFLPMVPQKEDQSGASINCIISESANDELTSILNYILSQKGNGQSFKNIAILVRKNMDIKTMKSYLERNNIACEVSKGAGLCELDIVQVIISFLKGLLNPSDAVAWFGIVQDILRDNDLFLQLLKQKDQSIQILLEKNSQVLEWQKQLQTGNMLSQLSYLVWKLPLAMSQNDQRAVQVFMAKFETMWETVAGNKKSVLDWLNACISAPKSMGIESESAEDAVQIMTLHAAKGLEFETVIVPFLDAQFNVGATDPMIISSESGIGLSIPKYSKQNKIRKHIYELEKKQAICEEIRLFYVTLTRAKSHLLLTGKELKRKNTSRLSLCLPYLKEPNGWVSFKFPGELKTTNKKQDVKPVDTLVSNNNVKIYSSAPIPHLTSFSMSNILDALDCPKQMMLKKFRPIEFIESEVQKEGLSMHAMLASVLIEKKKQPNDSDPEWLKNLITSPWYQRIICNGRLVVEEPFEYQYNTYIIRGRFDAVWFCDQSNSFQIFEFKRSIGRHLIRYQQQVNFYATVVASSYPNYVFDRENSAIINIQSGDCLKIQPQRVGIQTAINNLTSNVFTTNSNACSNCPYESLIYQCSDKQLRL